MAGAGTNQAEGVRLLKLTAEQGRYLAPFARLMLAVGELRDGRTQEGKAILFGPCTGVSPRTPLPARGRPPTLRLHLPSREIQHASPRSV
jgi:hypothetical protein